MSLQQTANPSSQNIIHEEIASDNSQHLCMTWNPQHHRELHRISARKGMAWLDYLGVFVLCFEPTLFPLDPDAGLLSGPIGLLCCFCIHRGGLLLLFCVLAVGIAGFCAGFLTPFLTRCLPRLTPFLVALISLFELVSEDCEVSSCSSWHMCMQWCVTCGAKLDKQQTTAASGTCSHVYTTSRLRTAPFPHRITALTFRISKLTCCRSSLFRRALELPIWDSICAIEALISCLRRRYWWEITRWDQGKRRCSIRW